MSNKFALIHISGFAAAVCAIMLSGCATVKGINHSVQPLELVDHGYEEMTILGVSERTASSLLNENISIESLRQAPEYTIRSNELAYIGRVVSLLKEAKSESNCTVMENLRWMIELRSADKIEVFTSNGEVITGPNDFCKSATGIENFDPLQS